VGFGLAIVRDRDADDGAARWGGGCAAGSQEQDEQQQCGHSASHAANPTIVRVRASFVLAG